MAIINDYPSREGTDPITNRYVNPDEAAIGQITEQQYNSPETGTNFFGQGLRSGFAQAPATDLYTQALEAEQKGDKQLARILKQEADTKAQQAALLRGNVPTWDQAKQQGIGGLKDYAMSGLGTNAAYMAPSLAGAMLPLGRLGKFVAATIPNYDMMKGSQIAAQYADPEQANKTPDERMRNAQGFGLANALAGSIVPAAAGNRFMPFGGKVPSFGRSLAEGGLAMVGQTAISDLGQQQLNPEHKILGDDAATEESFRQGVLGAAGAHSLALPGQALDHIGDKSLTAGMDLFNKSANALKDSSIGQKLRDEGVVGAAKQAAGTVASTLDNALLDGGAFVGMVNDGIPVGKAAKTVFGSSIEEKTNPATGNNAFLDKVGNFFDKGLKAGKEGINAVLFGKNGKLAETLQGDIAAHPEKYAGFTNAMSEGEINAETRRLAGLITDYGQPGEGVSQAAQRVLDGKATKDDVQLTLVAGKMVELGHNKLDNAEAIATGRHVSEVAAGSRPYQEKELANGVRDALGTAKDLHEEAHKETPSQTHLSAMDAIDKHIGSSDKDLLNNYAQAGALVRGARERFSGSQGVKALNKMSEAVNASGEKLGFKKAFSKMFTGNKLDVKDDVALGIYKQLRDVHGEGDHAWSDDKIKDVTNKIVMMANSDPKAMVGGGGRNQFYKVAQQVLGGSSRATQFAEALFKGPDQAISKLPDAASNALGLKGPLRPKGKEGTDHPKNVLKTIALIQQAHLLEHELNSMSDPRKHAELAKIYEEIALKKEEIRSATGTEEDHVDAALELLADPIGVRRDIVSALGENKAVIPGSDSNETFNKVAADIAAKARNQHDEYNGDDAPDESNASMEMTDAAGAGLGGMEGMSREESAPVASTPSFGNESGAGAFTKMYDEMQNKYQGTHNLNVLTMTNWADSVLPYDRKGLDGRNEVLMKQRDAVLAEDKKARSALETKFPSMKTQELVESAKSIHDAFKAKFGGQYIRDEHLYKDFASARDRSRSFAEAEIKLLANGEGPKNNGMTRSEYARILEDIYWQEARKGTAKDHPTNPFLFFDRYDQFRVIRAEPIEQGFKEIPREVLEHDEISQPLLYGKKEHKDALVGPDYKAREVNPEQGLLIIPDKNNPKLYQGLSIPKLMDHLLGPEGHVTPDEVLNHFVNIYDSLMKQHGDLPQGVKRILLDGVDLRQAYNADRKNQAKLDAVKAFEKERDKFVVVGKITLGDLIGRNHTNGFADIALDNKSSDAYKGIFRRNIAAEREKAAQQAFVDSKDKSPEEKAAAYEDWQQIKTDNARKDKSALKAEHGIVPIKINGEVQDLHLPTFIAHALALRGFTGNIAGLAKSTHAGLFISAVKDLQRRYGADAVPPELIDAINNPQYGQHKYSQLAISEGHTVRNGHIIEGLHDNTTTLGKLLGEYNKDDRVKNPLIDENGKSFAPTFEQWATPDLDLVANKVMRYESWLRSIEQRKQELLSRGQRFEDTSINDAEIAKMEKEQHDLGQQIHDNPAKAAALYKRIEELQDSIDHKTRENADSKHGIGIDSDTISRQNAERKLFVDNYLDGMVDRMFDHEDPQEHLLQFLMDGLGKRDAAGKIIPETRDVNSESLPWLQYFTDVLTSNIDALKSWSERSKVDEILARTRYQRDGFFTRREGTGVGAEERSGEARWVVTHEGTPSGHGPNEHNGMVGEALARGEELDAGMHPAPGRENGPLMSKVVLPKVTGLEAAIAKYGDKVSVIQDDLQRSMTGSEMSRESPGFTLHRLLNDPSSLAHLASEPGRAEAYKAIAEGMIRGFIKPPKGASQVGIVPEVTKLVDRLHELVQKLDTVVDKNHTEDNPNYRAPEGAPEEGKVGNATLPLDRDVATPPSRSDMVDERFPFKSEQVAQDARGMNSTGETRARPTEEEAKAAWLAKSESDIAKDRAARGVAPPTSETGRFEKGELFTRDSKAIGFKDVTGPKLAQTLDQMMPHLEGLLRGLPGEMADKFKITKDLNDKGEPVPEMTSWNPETKQIMIQIANGLAIPSMHSFAMHGAVHALFMSMRGEGASEQTRLVADKIGRVADSKQMRAKIDAVLRSLGETKEADRIKGMEGEERQEEYAAYMYQLSQLHGKDGQPLINISRDSMGIMEGIKRMLGWIIRKSTDAQQVNRFIDAWDKGKIDLGNKFNVADGLGRLYTDKAVDNIREAAKPILEIMSKLATDSEHRMREMNHPAATAIVNWYAGTRGKESYEEVLSNTMKKRLNELHFEVKGKLDSKEVTAALAEIHSGSLPTTEAGKAIWRWMGENGMIKDDRPELVWDMSKILDNPEAFKYDAENRGWADVTHLKAGEFDESTSNRVVNMLIESGLSHAVDVKAQHDWNSIEGQLGMKVQPKKGQYGNFSKYVQHDPSLYFPALIMRHARQEAQKAIFGTDGEGRANIKELQRAIYDVRNDKNLTSDHKQEIGNYIAMQEGRLGANLSPHLRNIQNYIMTATNILTLPMSIFSQLQEPLTIAARSGNLQDAFTAFKQGIKSMGHVITGKDGTGRDYEIGKMIGALEEDGFIDSMQYLINGTQMDGLPHKLNRLFFKYNLMEGWQRSQHAAAAGAGERFIIAHRDGNGDSARLLADLGLKPEDIKLDANGHLDMSDPTLAPKYASAITIFMRNAIALPTMNNTAMWMNDPHYALPSLMKRFTFAFHKDVMGNVTKEFKEHKNALPLATMLAALPISFMSGMLKHALKGSHAAGSSFGDAFFSALESSTLLGKWTELLQGYQSYTFGLPMGFNLLGPTAGIIAEGAVG